nr:hypothetical protein CFP56_44837 [Quercus suber]
MAFRGLSSIPSHELVSHYVHKLVQVLGESLHLTIDYLSSEEKWVVGNSKVDSVEVESSKLRKDLIKAMDQAAKAKEKVKELKDALKFIQYFKGFELLCRWTMKHHNQVVDFSNFNFEATDTKVLADETKEKEGEAITAAFVKEDGATKGGRTNEAHVDEGHMDEVVVAP